VLDPKNPDSYRAHVICIEAFVNTNNGQMYNEDMLSALQTIVGRYPGKLTFTQYHRDVGSFEDTLAIIENENLYEQYVNQFDGLKGVPDVFINGSVYRVKGASSVETAIKRIDLAIQPLLIENTFFTIEPTVTRSNTKISISTKIARLGSEPISDIIIRATVTEQIDSGLYTRVVRHMENSNLIPRLQPGEQKEIKYSDVTIESGADLQVIFTVTSNQSLIVYQSVEVAVP
jgi:methionine aminopeptidase